VSDGNGSNGNGNGHVENSVNNSVQNGRNGGTLRVGNPGNKGGPGRPPSKIREIARDEWAALIPMLRRVARSAKEATSDRLRAADQLGKYGLGTTMTETDTEGHDVPRPQVIAYIPENGRISNR